MSPSAKKTTSKKSAARTVAKRPKAKKKNQTTMAEEMVEFWSNPNTYALKKLNIL